MKKETAQRFLSKFVKVERLQPADLRPFNLYGMLEDVDEDSIILRTKQGLGAIRLEDIISISEAEHG